MLTHVFDDQMVDQKKKFKDNKQLIQLFSILDHDITKSIPIKYKMKLLNFIERLGGPDIAVYCLDLFPLNYYEFYLFIVAICCNFFLVVKLIESSLKKN